MGILMTFIFICLCVTIGLFLSGLFGIFYYGIFSLWRKNRKDGKRIDRCLLCEVDALPWSLYCPIHHGQFNQQK